MKVPRWYGNPEKRYRTLEMVTKEKISNGRIGKSDLRPIPRFYLLLPSRLEVKDGEIIEPRAPKIVDPVWKGAIDEKTKRVSLFPSVSQALGSQQDIQEGEKMTVYEAYNFLPENLTTPSTSSSPLSSITGERWLVGNGVQIRKVGEIEVGKIKKKGSIGVGSRGRQVPIVKREWKDLRPTWQKIKNPWK